MTADPKRPIEVNLPIIRVARSPTPFHSQLATGNCRDLGGELAVRKEARARIPPTLPIYTMLCFSKNRNANFTIRRENWSKSLTALGKKHSKNFKIAPLNAQREVDAVSTPTSTAWPVGKI